MRTRALLALAAAVAPGCGATAQGSLDPTTGMERRADALADRAAAERDPARRRALQREALSARIDAAEAAVALSRARGQEIASRLAQEQAALRARQEPARRLAAALALVARRPAVAAVVQPGSLDDLVRLRAALSALLPVVRARTADLRDRVARLRLLRVAAGEAALASQDGRRRLEEARRELAALNERAQDERALAIGEESRDILDRLRDAETGQARLRDLTALPGPPIRSQPGSRAAPYRLPFTVARVVTGFGELSPNGVRARGLTAAVAPHAPVAAPAGGRIVFARPFRRYGGVVIIDHGDGWTTLVSGLDALAVRAGTVVVAAAPLGRAGAGTPRLTVELRRRGRAVDPLALTG